VSLLLGLFDRPADAGCLKALWKVPAIPDLTEPLVGTSEAHRNLAFTRLQDAKLLRDTAGAHLAPSRASGRGFASLEPDHCDGG